MARYILSVVIAVSAALVLAACGGSASSPSPTNATSTPTSTSATHADLQLESCISEWNAGLAGTGSIPVGSSVPQTLDAIGVASNPTAYVTTAPPQQGALGEITPQGTCMIFWATATASAAIAPYSETGGPGGALAWTVISPQIPGSFLQDSLDDARSEPNAIFDANDGYTLAAYTNQATGSVTATSSSSSATTAPSTASTAASSTATSTTSSTASSSAASNGSGVIGSAPVSGTSSTTTTATSMAGGVIGSAPISGN